MKLHIVEAPLHNENTPTQQAAVSIGLTCIHALAAQPDNTIPRTNKDGEVGTMPRNPRAAKQKIRQPPSGGAILDWRMELVGVVPFLPFIGRNEKWRWRKRSDIGRSHLISI